MTVVTFGEVLLRLSPPGTEQFFQSPMLRTWWGGAEANVAAGLAYLGTPARHVTRLPTGPVGDAAVRALRADGVDVSRIERSGTRMGLYFLESGVGPRPLQVVYDRAHSAFAQLDPEQFDWPAMLADARWLHLSGISPALGDGPLQAVHDAIRAAQARGIPISLDLNYRPALWQGRDPRPLLQPLAACATMLIANPGAIEIMLGITTDGTMPEPPTALRATAERIHEQFGCTQVALTQRHALSASVHDWQAHLWDAASGAMHAGGAYRVELVDRVGGGDSFVAALLHRLLADAPLDQAVRFATAASALKLTIPGDVNRVRVADVERFLSTAP